MLKPVSIILLTVVVVCALGAQKVQITQPAGNVTVSGGSGGGDAYLANSQTFTGLTNTFKGVLIVSTQEVDYLSIDTLDLGTVVIPFANGGTGATNAAGVRTALSLVPGTDVQAYDADLTAMAAGTAVATPQTNAVSMGAPVLYVGTTNVAAAIAGISGGSGDVSSTGNNTLSGTNTFSGSTWIKPNRQRVVLFEKEWMGLTPGNIGYPEFSGTAIASGAATVIAGETNHPGIIRISSSSSANSGYYYLSSISGLFAEPLLTWESVSRVRGTNAGISKSFGFTDSATSSNPTDAIRMWRSNNFLIPQIWNNGSLVQGYEYPVSSNQFVYIKVQVQTNMTDVSFYAEDSDTKTLILSTNLTGTLPASSSRVFGVGHLGFFTNAVSISIEDLDWSTAYIDTPVNR